MANFSVVNGHLVSEEEYFEKRDAIVGMRSLYPSQNLTSVTLNNGAELSLQTARDGSPDPIKFPPIEYGKPLTIDIRSVYTGHVGSKPFLSGTGDIAIVSGVKDWGTFKASARGLNWVAAHTGKHATLSGPSALQDGTSVVAYERAVATGMLTATFELAAAPPDQTFLDHLGNAFAAAAGIPLFMPYAGALLIAGHLLPVAGKLVDALGGGNTPWSQQETINFTRPGDPPSISEYRIVASSNLPTKQLQFQPGVGLVDASGALYAGDEPYMVIAIYGGANPDLEHFALT